jgi:endo-1,4-beta-mannosidase
MRSAGLAKDAVLWKKMTDKSLDELELMGSNYIRVHLTPADFTDANGNLVQTIYLDLLDYMTAEAAKRGMYTSICFLNHMGGFEVQSSFMVDSHNKARAISTSDDKFFSRTMKLDFLSSAQTALRTILYRNL